MKEIINVEIKCRRVSDIAAHKTDLLAVGMFSDIGKLDKLSARLDAKLGGAIKRMLRLGDFKGKLRTSCVLYGDGKTGAKRVLLVGLGERKDAALDVLRKASAVAANKAVDLKVRRLSLSLHTAFEGQLALSEAGQAASEGAYFGSYRYDEFVTETEDGRLENLKVEIIDTETADRKKIELGASRGKITGAAQCYARTLANRPGNVINPPALANIARELARESKVLNCTVLGERQLVAKGMGGILAVGGGSAKKPRLIILEYKGAARSSAKKPTVALVGKAITFDSGGISIKPSSKMDEMKLDKSGGATVLGAIKAISELQLPLNVCGIVPSAENLPSSTSYRPGDIIKTFSGKSVEVQNTDAEGRMILCDALTYAVKQGCDIIIDIATLTGACKVALGTYMAGLMGNDDELIERLKKTAGQTGEKLWPMPCGDEYAEEMKSKIADLKNIGGKWGGACTAAAFLRQFVEDKKWAHLDIAGMDMAEKPTAITSPGSIGFGVRLLVGYLAALSE